MLLLLEASAKVEQKQAGQGMLNLQCHQLRKNSFLSHS